MPDRKPVPILKLVVLSDGENLTLQVNRNPSMSDVDMMLIVESLYQQIKDKYGKKTD